MAQKEGKIEKIVYKNSKMCVYVNLKMEYCQIRQNKAEINRQKALVLTKCP
jgi:hypothetical protein